MILSVPFCPYHFVRTILSPTILSVPFCPYHFVPYHFVHTILSVQFCSLPFCPYHFVRTILSVPFCPRTPQSHSIVFSCSFTYPRLSLICPMLMLAHRSRSVAEAELYGHLVVAIGHFQMMPTTD